MTEIVIAAAARTPVGAFNGGLSSVPVTASPSVTGSLNVCVFPFVVIAPPVSTVVPGASVVSAVSGVATFSGLSIDETAAVLGISPATVSREWSVARAYLFREISRQSNGAAASG